MPPRRSRHRPDPRAADRRHTISERLVDAHRVGKLGRGAQGVVHDLGPGLTLDDHPGPFVYKRYHTSTKIDPDGLEALIDARASLDRVRRDHLDEVTTWPLRLVVADGGRVTGVLLPRIPESYSEMRQQKVKANRINREVQFLLVAERKSILAVPPPEKRMLMCRDFAAVLAFLHDEVGVCFGDVSAKNALYRPNTRPSVLFVDCDGARARNAPPPARQLDSPDWGPLAREPVNPATDCFKLGLFVLRCLVPGYATQRDPSLADHRLDATGRSMLRAAINAPQAGRPTAMQWLTYFKSVLGEAAAPPRLHRVDIDRSVVVGGQPVIVRWLTSDARYVDVSPPGDRTVRVLAADGEVVVHPTRSGQCHVAACNELGRVAAQTEPITIVDMPALPRIPVQGLDGQGIAPPAISLGSAATTVPAAELHAPPMVSGGIPAAPWSAALPPVPVLPGALISSPFDPLRTPVAASAADDRTDQDGAS